tara:strand:- start:155 stop:385 length:231 start_codon:yes stop_codon:yes gene_type:complete
MADYLINRLVARKSRRDAVGVVLGSRIKQIFDEQFGGGEFRSQLNVAWSDGIGNGWCDHDKLIVLPEASQEPSVET